MKTIAEIFDKPKEKGGCLFGVEMELENIVRVPELNKYWRHEHDGSLRDNGREFIFNEPLNYKQAEKALKGLKDAFKEARIVPKASNLTSTHIHVDVRDLNVQQLLNMVAFLMMVEEDLAEASGEDRKTNYFALSTSESAHRLQDLISVKTDDQFRMFVRKQVGKDNRYAGINFNSIWQHGSLEIRYLGGQKDPLTVLPWLRFYENVKALSKNEIDFEDLYRNISIDGVDQLARMLEANFPLTIDNVIEGIRNAQTFILGTSYKVLTAPEDGNGLANYYNNI